MFVLSSFALDFFFVLRACSCFLFPYNFLCGAIEPGEGLQVSHKSSPSMLVGTGLKQQATIKRNSKGAWDEVDVRGKAQNTNSWLR